MVTINWYKNGKIADNGTYLSYSPIELRSLGHGEDLARYEIYERLPKFLRKKSNYREVSRGPLPAAALPPKQGRYHTQSKWNLPGPQKEKPDGRRRFVARAAKAVSPEVHSAAMLVGSWTDKTTTENKTDVEVRAHGLRLRLPSLFHRRHKRCIRWDVHPSADPRVE